MRTTRITVGATLLASLAMAAPAGADPTYPGSYGSNGVFGVGVGNTDPRATAVIPPGRYRVDQAPSLAPFQSAPGSWYRCSDFPCGPGYSANVIASGAALRDIATEVDILPTDVAVSLHNVTLTAVR
ncbi:hypothetical protein [Mycolicibacterium confluentis]|nr:hypothetical protein [Mycolicibacterium confluentis]ORV30389.1 hypothetical protein AWB99_13160 [Mycolicibacterium confluentis]